MMRKCYTGIGARDTPETILSCMTEIAEILCGQGYTLRSGGARGADTAFANGGLPEAEIFIPWNGFNGYRANDTRYFLPLPETWDIVKDIHPAWKKLNHSAKLLHMRNVHQVLGKYLSEPSKFLICFTNDGKMSGGTATAMRLAEQRGIPVFNLYHLNDRRKVWSLVDQRMKDFENV